MARPLGNQDAELRLLAAYDAVLAQWPVTGQSLDLDSQFGITHLQASGPEDAPSMILLSGGGATSTVWFNNVEALSRDHRVYALDTMGDVGCSIPGGRPIDRPDLQLAWMDSVLDGLGLLGVCLVGHSYGAQIALSYALHAPHRVRSLVLLDPTGCFSGMSPGYLLRAAPVLIRPSAERLARLIHWETQGAELNPAWLELLGLGAEIPKVRPIVQRPNREKLAASTVPTLILLAEHSRVLNIAKVARSAREMMPRAVIGTVPGVSHHGMPMLHAEELNRAVLTFVG